MYIKLDFPILKWKGECRFLLREDKEFSTWFLVQNDDIEFPVMQLLAYYYDFAEKKVESQPGEIWIGNPSKDEFNYHFKGVWPTSINFGDLDYSSSTEFEIEVIWKYQEMIQK